MADTVEISRTPLRRLHMAQTSTCNSLGLPRAASQTRVVVAMSGGVDSSVVAALLKQEGYDVVGITLQLYDHGSMRAGRTGTCCAGRDIHDARAVASALRIPHYVLDYEERFRAKVIEPFADSYVRGETPIPCVSCNQHVKFADLFDTARDLGADALATGHYIASRAVEGGRALFRAHDRDRDQSYFLYATTREQLEFLRFPLGERPKAEVRGLARAFGLTVADKADSQDICFVPTGRYADLVARLRPEAMTEGEIVHVDGRVLGRHRGLAHYTVGQRKGLGLADSPAAGGEPLYVVRLDTGAGRVVVGPRSALATASVTLRDVNWIGPGTLEAALEARRDIAVRLRSTRAPVPARLAPEGARVVVDLVGHEDGVSRGQACVFYASTEDDARVLGGGIIAATRAASSPAGPADLVVGSAVA